MTILERLEHWKQTGIVREAQYATLSSLIRKQQFSVFVELNALLYLGVVSLAAGLGWTFKTYFANLGDAFILTTLSAILSGSLYYCFSRGPGYSTGELVSTNIILDYVLYFACLVFAAEIGYIEFRYQLLQTAWDNYLLFSSAVFFFLAYRFDNRFVLSLGLSSLAGWFGLRLGHYGVISSDSLRLWAFIYGALVLLTGIGLYRTGVKKHFLEAYLHIAANVVLLAALSGVGNTPAGTAYIAVLFLLSLTTIVLGFRFRRFAFVAYGIGYGYVGISSEMMHSISGDTAILSYFIVTGTAVIVSMSILARRFGREE